MHKEWILATSFPTGIASESIYFCGGGGVVIIIDAVKDSIFLISSEIGFFFFCYKIKKQFFFPILFKDVIFFWKRKKPMKTRRKGHFFQFSLFEIQTKFFFFFYSWKLFSTRIIYSLILHFIKVFLFCSFGKIFFFFTLNPFS